MEMHSVANLAILSLDSVTFFSYKKAPSMESWLCCLNGHVSVSISYSFGWLYLTETVQYNNENCFIENSMHQITVCGLIEPNKCINTYYIYIYNIFINYNLRSELTCVIKLLSAK